MELVTDARRLVGSCLQFNIEETIEKDPHVMEVIGESEIVEKVLAALLKDYDAGTLPTGSEDAFPEAWKAYMKTLGNPNPNPNTLV
jgi:endonuclease IV